MSDKPIDLQRRKKLLTRMSQLEKGMKELRREFATPEQLQKLALGEIQLMEKHFAPMANAVKVAQAWLLEMMTLQGVIAKLGGHEPDPADALALVLKNTDFLKDPFQKSVIGRIAKLEDELIDL